MNVQKKQSEYYSGKNKQYKLKAQIIVHWRKGLIFDVQTCKGLVHDFSLYKQTCLDWLLKSTTYLADSGYQGIANLHNYTFTLFKKPKDGKLLTLCKQAN